MTLSQMALSQVTIYRMKYRKRKNVQYHQQLYNGDGYQSLGLILNRLNVMANVRKLRNNSKASSTLCKECNKAVKDDDKSGNCCQSCNGWVHGGCVNLSVTDVEWLGSKPNCLWVSNSCVNNEVFTNNSEDKLTSLFDSFDLRRFFHIPPRFLFTTHSRENEVNTFRLLTGHCPLNGFLYKVWLTESPRCPCGSNVESVRHFILECPRYEEIRSKFNFGNLAESMLNSQLPLFIKQTERFARHKHEP